jgi:hypothetical protein
MDRKTKGRLAESYATIWFIEREYEVYLPAHGNTKYDLLAVKNGKVERVSVKACGAKTSPNRWGVRMYQSSRRKNAVHYDKFIHSDYDLVAVWIIEEKRIVVCPASQVDPAGNFLYIPTLESQTTGE